MSDYVLDTDTCIYWLNGEEKIRRRIEQVEPASLKVTVISLAELRYGAYNSRNVDDNLNNIENFLRIVRVLPLDNDAADRFGKIKVDLRNEGRIIEDDDILIAALTLSHGGVLVTNNVEHFKRISALNYVNWLED